MTEAHAVIAPIDSASIHLAPGAATPYTRLPETAEQPPGERNPDARSFIPWLQPFRSRTRTLISITEHLTRQHLRRRLLPAGRSLAAIIDHSLLKAEATRKQVETLCDEAARYRFASVMVNPIWASTAVSLLAGTDSRRRHDWISARRVAGSTLRQEAAALIRLGVREVGMVLPIGQLKSGNHQGVSARHSRRC